MLLSIENTVKSVGDIVNIESAVELSDYFNTVYVIGKHPALFTDHPKLERVRVVGVAIDIV